MSEVEYSNFIDRSLVNIYGSETIAPNPSYSSLADTVLYMSAITLGVGGGELIHHTAFAEYGKYNQVEGSINTITGEVQAIRNVQYVQHLRLSPAQKKVFHKLQTNISVENAKLPHGYDPNVDSVVSLAGGIGTAAIAAIAGGVILRRSIRRARERLA